MSFAGLARVHETRDEHATPGIGDVLLVVETQYGLGGMNVRSLF